MKSLVLAVRDGTIEIYKDLFKEMLEVRHLTILMSSFNDIKYTSLIGNWRLLETIVLGASDSHFPMPMLAEIINKFQCLNNLATIHFHRQEMLTNRDIDTISRFKGRTIKEIYLDMCSNVDDLCLYNIKVRFQNLLVLAVCNCKRIRGTFLQQNYQNFETVPKVKKLKLRLCDESNPEFIINAIELVRTHSRNMVKIIFI